MLKPPYPSSPQRPPIEHLKFTITNNDEETETFFITKAFAASYAAHHWLDQITQDRKLVWHNENYFTITEDNTTLHVRGDHLEDMIEYQPTAEEQQYIPQPPDSHHLYRVKHFDTIAPQPTPTPPVQTEEKPVSVSYKAPKRHKSTKLPSDGYITVAQMANDLNLQPNKARNILRKANIKKPPNGWTYKIDSPEHKQILKVLKSHP